MPGYHKLLQENPPRIAYLVSQYPALTHTFILREILALRSLGFEIDVIAIRGDHRPPESVTEHERLEHSRTVAVLPIGFDFVLAHLYTLLRYPSGYLAGLWLALKLGSGFRSSCFHLIYFLEAVVAGHIAVRRGHGYIHTHFSSTVGLLAARVFGLRLSITIHGPDEFRNVIGFRMREKVAAACLVCTISQFARSQIMQAVDPRDWHKIRVCRLGVDTSLFVPVAAPGLPPVDGAARLISVGRLAPVKGLRILISACALAISRGVNLQLRLVGGGDDLAALRAHAADCGMREQIVFEGPRNQDEVISLFRQSQIFVMSSFAEGVPVSLMEAMAMELPCAATWVNGIPELITSGEEGILTAPSDVVALASVIERLVADAGLRQRLGQEGRRKVLRDFNLQTNTEALAALFREQLASPDEYSSR